MDGRFNPCTKITVPWTGLRGLISGGKKPLDFESRPKEPTTCIAKQKQPHLVTGTCMPLKCCFHFLPIRGECANTSG